MPWCSHPSSFLISQGRHPQSWCLDIFVKTLSVQNPKWLTHPVENRDSQGLNQTSDNSQRGADLHTHLHTRSHTHTITHRHTMWWSEVWSNQADYTEIEDTFSLYFNLFNLCPDLVFEAAAVLQAAMGCPCSTSNTNSTHVDSVDEVFLSVCQQNRWMDHNTK